MMLALLDKLTDISFQIGSRCRTGYDIGISIWRKTRGHENIVIQHRRGGENLINRPGSGNDGSVSGIDHAGAKATVKDIEIFGNDLRSMLKARCSRGFLICETCNICRLDQIRQQAFCISKTIECQQLLIVRAPNRSIHY